MHETPADLVALQSLLDRSYATAGRHLRSIITPERRLTADEVADRLTGMRLLALATVTADGRPIVGPVDGIFFRGSFHFGSAPDSVRFRHIRNRPQVSATHLPGEELAVTVHGRAVPLDIQSSTAVTSQARSVAGVVPEILRTMSLRPDFLAAIDAASTMHFTDGALTRAQHEMVASYVSALNRCRY